MAVAVTLAVSPAAPNHGDTVTATYTVAGNVPVSNTTTSPGSITIGGIVYQVATTLTIPAAPVTYNAPTCSGLSFAATSTPGVFTAVTP